MASDTESVVQGGDRKESGKGKVLRTTPGQGQALASTMFSQLLLLPGRRCVLVVVGAVSLPAACV